MGKDKEIKVQFNDDDEQPDSDNNDETVEAPEDAAGESENSSDAAVETETAPELTEEEKLTAQVVELEDRLLRSAAEFDNFKKRTVRRFEEIVRSANDRILLQLLEVVDNFERALDHGDEQADLEGYREGMKLIYEQLTTLLDKHEVSPIEAVGKPFDPNLHEAVMQTESDEYPEGTVAIEMSKGYRQGGRILRHSKVGVSAGASEFDDSGGNEEAENDE